MCSIYSVSVIFLPIEQKMCLYLNYFYVCCCDCSWVSLYKYVCYVIYNMGVHYVCVVVLLNTSRMGKCYIHIAAR